MGIKHLLLFTLLFWPLAESKADIKNKEMRACIDDHPPLQILGSPPSGTHIEALNKLAKTLNKQLSFLQAPNFARCVVMLKNGQADVIVSFNKSPEREKFTFYAPYKREAALVVITNKNTAIVKYDDLAGKIIGVPRGFSYFPKFDHDKSLNKIEIQNVRIGIELVKKGRLDIVITSYIVARSLLTDISSAELKITKLDKMNINRGISFFGFSKKNSLDMSEEEITFLTTQAFEKGMFDDAKE